MFANMRFTAKLRKSLGKRICWEDHPQLGPVLGRLLERLKIRRPVSVFIFSGYKPLIFNSGWIRPAIFISPLLLEKLSREELEAVLAHELAHVGHYDQLIISLAGVLKGLFVIIPGRDGLWRKFMLSREIFCDETASRVTSKRLVLAETLIKIWKMGKSFPVHAWLERQMFYYALLEKESSLELRVRKLLLEEGKTPGRGRTIGSSGRRRGLIIALMAVASAMFFQQMAGVGGEKGSSLRMGEGYVGGQSLSDCHRAFK